jgi:hypothetical protein
MSKVTRKFDRELLTKAVSEANATLQGEYKELNGASMIHYTCRCSKECNKGFNFIIYYGGAYCKECVNKNKAEKMRNTCTERYGVINPSQLQEIKDKKNETYDKHFGCHPLQSKEIQEKRAALHMEKYGCVNPGQRPEIKEKIKKAFNEKYDGHPMFDEIIKEKVKETCLQKYGVSSPAQNVDVRNKMKQTTKENYGVEYAAQSVEIMEKLQKTGKKYKNYTLPSGKIILIQGYEHFALNILLQQYSEDQIITERGKVPRILYSFNDKEKYYFPDMFIPSKNKIIEVKSTWTYSKDLDKNTAKWNATREKGYVCEVWIFSPKGERIKEEDMIKLHASADLHP